MRNRHRPHLCERCGAALASQSDDCWACGARRPAGDGPAGAEPLPPAVTTGVAPQARGAAGRMIDEGGPLSAAERGG